MSRNAIQFQKGLSLPKFLEKYGLRSGLQGSAVQTALARGFPLPGMREQHQL